MLSEEKLKRLRTLAQKKREDSLTPEEAQEREALHQEYLKNFRRGMRSHIEGIKVVNSDGDDITPDTVKRIQKEKGLHQRENEDIPEA
ncbi:hypothetical protein CL176_07800 [Suicoccus acidiformans]|uniref:UPF0291 protein CL176_07800 n=1 Tax=Suicoccus acidiformans TaxID=2036206 RepID=A0A347WLF0_9LACT|nr:DUF896 domain-containing protein [Suicoccus acidiformans]AXY25907.1 hypothetical protein CL176_07800 [Suicoccus acidiformans]